LIRDGEWLFENFESDSDSIDFGGNDKYHEDDVLEYLYRIKPYTIDGEIDYFGEDDAMWRFKFIDGKWEYQDGSVVYEELINEKLRPEFIGQIIDIFDDETDKENPVFTGEKYDRVTEKLNQLMKAWRVF
jgi:hypothetical protein